VTAREGGTNGPAVESLGSLPTVSRRAALAKLGAGTAIAWTAPTVLSITAKAAAGSVPCGNNAGPAYSWLPSDLVICPPTYDFGSTQGCVDFVVKLPPNWVLDMFSGSAFVGLEGFGFTSLPSTTCEAIEEVPRGAATCICTICFDPTQCQAPVTSGPISTEVRLFPAVSCALEPEVCGGSGFGTAHGLLQALVTAVCP
jgi:hypothetical protein